MNRNEMLVIPGGDFEMGISTQDAENYVKEFFEAENEIDPYLLYPETPNHKVKLRTFSISKYEVSNLEFKQFVDAGGYETRDFWKELIFMQELNTDLHGWDRIDLFRDSNGNPKFWDNGKYPEAKADHPVDGVSWFEAIAYCRWKKCRLPSEAEWEYAARGADQRKFPWGNIHESAVNDRSPFGVMNMAGSVSEWVADTWYPYPNSPLGKLEKVDEQYGILRGGNYLSEPYQMRTTYRERVSRLDTSLPTGFRCAK